MCVHVGGCVTMFMSVCERACECGGCVYMSMCVSLCECEGGREGGGGDYHTAHM